MNAWLSADTSYSTPFLRKGSFSGSNQYVNSEFHVSITVSIVSSWEKGGQLIWACSTKCKANDEQLDRAEEAKVETLEQRERASTNKIATNDGGTNFASFSSETAEEEDAHETLCAAEKGLVTKWTCDVCNPVHLKHLRKQRLKKVSAAPPPPKENSNFIRQGRKFS